MPSTSKLSLNKLSNWIESLQQDNKELRRRLQLIEDKVIGAGRNNIKIKAKLDVSTQTSVSSSSKISSNLVDVYN